MPRIPLSGEQFVLAGFGYLAEIASVGATLRTLSHDGRSLIAGFAADRLRPAMRGALLVPWPNRTADGRYVFDGEAHQLVVDEPSTHTAVHGLMAWAPFVAAEHSAERLLLEATLAPRPGYPWRLQVRVLFQLEAGGLRQEVLVRNESGRPAPVGIGGHPALLAGPGMEGAVDGWSLELDASQVVQPSSPRMLPDPPVAVETLGDLDFRTPRRIGKVVLNHCYTGFRRSDAGGATVRLRGADGLGSRIEWDARCEWLQVYSSDEAVDGLRRAALALEPMTCPPDALNSGTGLLTVRPGATASAGWLVGAL